MAKKRPPLWPFVAISACLNVSSLIGCSNSGPPSGDGENGGESTGGVGTGGTSGVMSSGGASGSSGEAGSGGVAPSGGVSSGGVSGTGGSTESGGTSGAGGATGVGGGVTGGSAGVGGASGDGGMSGAGGTAATGGSAGVGGASGGGNAGSGGKANTCPPGTPSTGGTRYCSNSKGNAGGGYTYELWAEGTGTGCMTVFGSQAKFSATWSNVEDFLARVGLEWDRTRTHTQIGTISAEFSLTKTEEGGGLTYVGIYGWTVDPLREYYILDDWGSVKPAGTASDGTPRTSVGTLTADGETYDVWMKTRMNKPAITGDNMTFDQYFSIRRTARQCGRISVSEHFRQWTSLGLQLGKLVEAKWLAEAQNNSGSIEFTTATVTVN